MEMFSHSRLDTYQSCNRRFYYKYILDLKDEPGLPAIFGKTAHKAIELNLKGRSFEDAVTTAWIEEADMFPSVVRKELETHVNNALHFARNMSDLDQVEAEKHFVLKLSEGIKLQGYIDLIMNTSSLMPTLVDWKTGRVVTEVLDKKQMSLYSAYIMDTYKVDRCVAISYFTRFRSFKKEIITRDIADEAKEWAIRVAREIQGKLDLLPVLSKKETIKAFPATPGYVCKWCCWGRECLVDDQK